GRPLPPLATAAPYAPPALVSTDKPDYWALYIYLAVVPAAAFALARVRLWRWLAAAAIVFAVLWMAPGIGERELIVPHVFHALVGFVVVSLLIVSGLFYGAHAQPRGISEMASPALGALPFAL